ncbi:MAG: hypothetical protein ACREPX_14935, partial [Rhodanobacteraceae bacterium]
MPASSILPGRRVSSRIGGALLLVLATLAESAHARTLTLKVERVQNPSANASGLDLTVQEGARGSALD